MSKDPRKTYILKQLLLILSACALFAVNARSMRNMLALPLSAVALFFWTRYDHRLIEHKPVSPIWNLFFALSALGIALAPVSLFQKSPTVSRVMAKLQAMSGIDAVLLSRLACGVLVVGALWFTFCAVRYFYALLQPVVRDIAADFSRTEYWVLAGASLAFMVAVGVLFVKTNAFAHPWLECDLLYSSDSGAYINYQSFFRLGGLENDIRSPLFALFSAPFLGFPYLVSLLIPLANAQALVLTMAQVPFHIVSWYLIIKMIPDLKLGQRFSLLALALVSYSGFLFSFFPEQYIFSVFWIALFLYRYILRNRREDFLLLGAAGTMITSAVFAFLPDPNPAKQSFGSRVKATFVTGLKGLGVLLAFGCSDVLLSYQHVTDLMTYTNVVGSFTQKLMQFSALIGSTFFAANAGSRCADAGDQRVERYRQRQHGLARKPGGGLQHRGACDRCACDPRLCAQSKAAARENQRALVRVCVCRDLLLRLGNQRKRHVPLYEVFRLGILRADRFPRAKDRLVAAP